jgi:hypothetical protein
MAFGRPKTPEEIAEQEQRKAMEQAAKEQRRAAEEAERAQRAFEASPQGRARRAYQAGNYLFQFSMDVMNQQPVIVAMVGSTALQQTFDPSDVINSVAAEGWDLVNASFVFVEQGQQSRDKFMSSGQNVAIKGETVGYYVFRRRG